MIKSTIVLINNAYNAINYSLESLYSGRLIVQ